MDECKSLGDGIKRAKKMSVIRLKCESRGGRDRRCCESAGPPAFGRGTTQIQPATLSTCISLLELNVILRRGKQYLPGLLPAASPNLLQTLDA